MADTEAHTYPPAVLPTDRVNYMRTQDIHPTDHNAVNDAVNLIVGVLGIDPTGGADTLSQRLRQLADLIEAKSVESRDYTDTEILSHLSTHHTDAPDQTYIHHQMVASSLWIIEHGIGQYPSVVTVDSSGQVHFGDVSYPDANTVHIAFSVAFSGRAFLNT